MTKSCWCMDLCFVSPRHLSPHLLTHSQALGADMLLTAPSQLPPALSVGWAQGGAAQAPALPPCQIWLKVGRGLGIYEQGPKETGGKMESRRNSHSLRKPYEKSTTAGTSSFLLSKTPVSSTGYYHASDCMSKYCSSLVLESTPFLENLHDWLNTRCSQLH